MELVGAARIESSRTSHCLKWEVKSSVVDPDPHGSDTNSKVGSGSASASMIKVISWIRIRIYIRIKVMIWLRIRINLQITSQMYGKMSLIEHFIKVSSLYLEARSRIRNRIKVKGRIRILIRIKGTCRIRIRIQVTSKILICIRIRIKVVRIRNTVSKKACFLLLFSVFGDLTSGIPGCLSCLSWKILKLREEFWLSVGWYGMVCGACRIYPAKQRVFLMWLVS